MELKKLKLITWLLRHGAIKENILIDQEGFIKIDDLINWLKTTKNILLNHDDIIQIVKDDNKNRFLLKNNMIRVNQGHSIELNITMDKFQQNNSQLIHATYYKNYDSIKETGLKSMSRNDVHLINIDSKTNKFHMIRQDTDLYIFVNNIDLDLKESTNGVILTGEIPPKNITLVPAYDFKKSHCYGFIIFDKTNTKVLCVITPNNKIGFPKGKKEKNEIPLCCAFRELKEETNLDPEDINILPNCISEINENNNVPTNYYFAQIRNTDKELFCADKDENLSVKWITIQELLNTKDDIFYDRRKLLL
jgi:RNA:NAD 2'-phosphotransferase (TPT1/KptA family)/8-oxo-dGTP pyrophosphatase MutT (NUDIX family)